MFGIPFVLLLNVSNAQLNLSSYHGFVFADQFTFKNNTDDYYSGKIESGYQWGLGLQYKLTRNHFELIYLRQAANAPVHYKNDTTTHERFAEFALNINYVMAAAGAQFRISSEKLEGFGDLMAGAAIVEATKPGADKMSNTVFAWGLRMGIDYWPLKRIGLKVFGQLLSPTGGSLFFGSSKTPNLFASVHQFSLNGGIIFKLTQKNKL